MISQVKFHFLMTSDCLRLPIRLIPSSFRWLFCTQVLSCLNWSAGSFHAVRLWLLLGALWDTHSLACPGSAFSFYRFLLLFFVVFFLTSFFACILKYYSFKKWFTNILSYLPTSVQLFKNYFTLWIKVRRPSLLKVIYLYPLFPVEALFFMWKL